MSNNDQGWYGGRRLDTLGPNELSKIKATLEAQEQAAASNENYEAACKYRDKKREVQRHFNELLEDTESRGRRRR